MYKSQCRGESFVKVCQIVDIVQTYSELWDIDKEMQ